MAAATATKRKKPPAKKAAPAKKGGKLRLVGKEPERPAGDEALTVEAMSMWKAGQRTCRARKRHNWGPSNVYEHAGHYEVIEICSHCRNRRAADFVPTARGLRKMGNWQPLYRDGYLLPRGAMRLDEDLNDELTAADILSRRIIEVPDETDE